VNLQDARCNNKDNGIYLLRIDESTVYSFGLLARSQYPEGPATGHFEKGFS